jgi:hypothetical protein
VVAAIAGAAAAGAAWRAAIHSERTSRQSSEALIFIERPTVQTHGIYTEELEERLTGVAYVADNGSWDARDLTVRVRKRDGRSFEARTEWLREGSESLRVELGDFPPDPGGYAGLQIDHIVIRFADRRRAAMYERHEDYSHLTRRRSFQGNRATHLTSLTRAPGEKRETASGKRSTNVD